MAEKYNTMRLSRLPVSLAAALCAGLLATLPLPVLADNLQDASRLMKQGQFGPALEKTEQALAAKPKDAQARFLKGLILTEMGKQAAAQPEGAKDPQTKSMIRAIEDTMKDRAEKKAKL